MMCLWGAGLLIFHGFIIYALAVTHVHGVMDACGTAIWTFLLVHLLAPFMLLCLCCMLMLCVYVLTTNTIMQAQSLIKYYFVGAVAALVYFTAFCGIGAWLASKPVPDSCSEAVRSATGSAIMLQALAWVYVALDGLDALLSLIILAGLSYVNYFLP